MIDSLKKIFKLFPGKDRVKLLILFFMMLVSSFLEVLGISVIPAFVVAVAEPDRILELNIVGDFLKSIGITSSESLVIYGAILLIVVYITKNVYLVFYQYLKKKFVANRGVYLQNRIFKAYLTAPYTFHLHRNSAETLRNVTAEVNKVINGTILPFMDVALKVTMFVFIIGTLMYLEPLITLATILLLGVCGYFFLRLTQEKTRDYGRKDRNARKSMNKVVLQGLGGFKDSRVLAREKMFLKQYDHYAKISRTASIFKAVVKSMPKPIIETLLVVGILTITLIMVWEGRTFTSIIAILTLFGAAAVKLMPIFNNVINDITTIGFSAPSVDAIFDDIHYLENEEKEFRKKILTETETLELKEKIEFENLSYHYPDSDEQAIRDVSLSIPKGHAVAFVGPSGAGKTTLVDVALGLLEPQKGRILIDGVDIQDNIRGWMKNIGYIPQSIYLLDDRISRNIAFGIPDDEVDQDKLWRAIRAAQLEELIDRLPHKEKTRVGERGVRLSGGQQQRIGIARALYNNPQVLIMDEATSALDNITEKFVIDAIENLRGDRTIIMIAHRLTTVRNCDTIYLMNEALITDQGSYDELLANSEEFRKMSLVED